MLKKRHSGTHWQNQGWWVEVIRKQISINNEKYLSKRAVLGSVIGILEQSWAWLIFTNISLTEWKIGIKDQNSIPVLIVYVDVFTAIHKRQLGRDTLIN